MINTKTLIILLGALLSNQVWAGPQVYEELSASIRASLQKSVSDNASPRLAFKNEQEGEAWLDSMAQRLKRSFPDPHQRRDFLISVHYEASRAGLDPQMVLGLIQVESGFKKYALSTASARGFMQIMPFWVKVIGTPDNNLFHQRTNLRYGCTILRHYLDIEKGNLYRALGRYNGSLGQPEYPNLVLGAWKNHWAWNYAPNKTAAQKSKDQPS